MGSKIRIGTALSCLSLAMLVAALRSEPAQASATRLAAPPANAAIPQVSTPDLVVPNGWYALYTSASEGTKLPVEVHTHSPAAAFALDRGETLHPEVEMVDLRASFTADVSLATSGTYRFGFEMEGGHATVRVVDVNGREVAVCRADQAGEHYSDWIELPRGRVELTASFARDGYERARLQTRWEMKYEQGRGGFPAEPIPAHVTRVPASAQADVATGLLARRGRILLERKGCVNCHTTGKRNAVDTLVAPRMDDVGERLTTSWMARWIHRPADLRANANMPALLPSGEAGRAEAADIAAFLAGRSQPTDTGSASGRTLYHQIGCVACHGALTSLANLSNDEFQSHATPGAPVAPFGDVHGKWRRDALVRFLLNPAASHPAGRMPNFGLEQQQAEDLADYLRGAWEGGAAGDPVAAERGREAWALRGCGTCHLLEGGRTELQTELKLEQLDLTEVRGCLDPTDADSPRYELSRDERAALVAGIASVRRAGTWPAPLDHAERGMEALACTACHTWNGAGGPAEELKPYFQSRDELTDLGDEGRLPPNLTSVGFKLTTPWMRRVLLEGAAARPYLGARMPQFGWTFAEDLAGWIARREGVWPDTDETEPEATEARVLTGRQLMGPTAMACTTCHSFKDYPPSGTPGPNLIAFGERLRYAWWRSYVHDPARYKPGTRMPSFSSGNVSNFPEFANGTLSEQADCMWAYFSLGEFMPAPEGVGPAESMQIRVGERPVVMRTFLENAGARGIAVGFPIGIHFGFDAAGVRLAEVWQGEFLDAAGAWAGRGGQVAGGRGTALWTAPEGPAFVFGPRPDEWPTANGRDAGFRFRGYELDAEGRPEFAYDYDGASFRESFGSRLEPGPALRRRFAVTGWAADRTLWLNPGAGKSLVVDLRGVEPVRVDRPDDTAWFRLQPTGDHETRTFTLEVTP